MEIKDIIIVGGGPAGLAAAMYSAQRRLDSAVLEANRIGGQPILLYPDKPITDLPGQPDISGRMLTEKLISQVQAGKVPILEKQPVVKISPREKYITAQTETDSFSARCIILASGLGHYEPRRLGVPGEAAFFEKGIYYQKLPERLVGKRLVVVGGGDTALEVAITAAQLGAAVTLVHRRDSFRAMDDTVEKARNLGIPMHLNAKVCAFTGDENLQSVEIVRNSGMTSLITVDSAVICIGMALNTGFLAANGFTLVNQAVETSADMQTNIPGIFACGDVTVPSGSYKRISVAFGTAATAVNSAYRQVKRK